MERRLGLRARTDFRVVASDGAFRAQCRGIEISAMGIVLDVGRWAAARAERVFLNLELALPERCRPIHALARPIWGLGTQRAFKFIRISDVDRLTLAEHLDLMHLRGTILC